MTLASVDALEIVPLFLGDRSTQLELEQLRISGNGIEGSAQLVGHRRQELALRRIRLLRFLPSCALALDEMLVLGDIDSGRKPESTTVGQRAEGDPVEIPDMILPV